MDAIFITAVFLAMWMTLLGFVPMCVSLVSAINEALFGDGKKELLINLIALVIYIAICMFAVHGAPILDKKEEQRKYWDYYQTQGKP